MMEKNVAGNKTGGGGGILGLLFFQGQFLISNL